MRWKAFYLALMAALGFAGAIGMWRSATYWASSPSFGDSARWKAAALGLGSLVAGWYAVRETNRRPGA